jgi:hypothetical protein
MHLVLVWKWWCFSPHSLILSHFMTLLSYGKDGRKHEVQISWHYSHMTSICLNHIRKHNHLTTATMLVSKIKEESFLWCLARAKALSIVMPWEWFYSFVISPFVGQGQVCKTSKNLFLINEMANILPRFQKKKSLRIKDKCDRYTRFRHILFIPEQPFVSWIKIELNNLEANIN